jgi:predicted nucleic acid-binding protein
VVLPDTSVWVEFSRRGSDGRAAGLAALLDAGEVATCGPVAAELLAGAKGEVAERMWETLSSLPWAELDPTSWREVGSVAARLRHGGRTLPLTDLVIAVAAARGGHGVWSFDADFERIGTVLADLELHQPGDEVSTA